MSYVQSNNRIYVEGSYSVVNESFKITHVYLNAANHSVSNGRLVKRTPKPNLDLFREGSRLHDLATRIAKMIMSTAEPSDEYTRFGKILVDLSKIIPHIMKTFESRQDEFSEASLLGCIRTITRDLDEFSTNHSNGLYHISRIRRVSPAARAYFILRDLVWRAIYGDSVYEIQTNVEKGIFKIKSILFDCISTGSGTKDVRRKVYGHRTEVCDFFGMRWSIPKDVCLDQQAFLQLMIGLFSHGPPADVVSKGRFCITFSGIRKISARSILCEPRDYWRQTITGEGEMRLSVLNTIDQSKLTMVSKKVPCPRCFRSNGYAVDSCTWTVCGWCKASFQVAASYRRQPRPRVPEADNNVVSPVPQKVERQSNYWKPGPRSIFRFYTIVVTKPGTGDAQPTSSPSTPYSTSGEASGDFWFTHWQGVGIDSHQWLPYAFLKKNDNLSLRPSPRTRTPVQGRSQTKTSTQVSGTNSWRNAVGSKSISPPPSLTAEYLAWLDRESSGGPSRLRRHLDDGSRTDADIYHKGGRGMLGSDSESNAGLAWLTDYGPDAAAAQAWRLEQLERDRLEEQEFRAARAQLAGIDLRPPRPWTPSIPQKSQNTNSPHS